MIKNNDEMMLKLASTGILLAAAQQKINNYLQVHTKITQEIMEDELAMEYFNLYYEENEAELKKAAKESIITSLEAEESFNKWSNQDEL